MTIVVTAATGHFGRLAIKSLLAKGVAATEIVAVGRNVGKIADLGVTVKQAAYEDVDALKEAFVGAEKLLLISAGEPKDRAKLHGNAIDAAKAAGVSLIAYTSAPKADTSDMLLVKDHLETEELLAASGVPFVILRNGWYIENYNVAQALEKGLVGASGDGKIAGATRADLAEAAASVLVGEGHEGQIYELGGEPFTLTELAAEITKQSGTTVTYTNLGVEEYAALLASFGLPAEFAAILADSDRAAADGALYVERTDLEKLLGRPVTPLSDAVKKALV